ncbi:anti-sigma factor domain-containing protein [Candidatus Nitrospira bockiana]
MTHEQIEEALPLYAVGALDRQERHAVEAHLLTGCTTCHALVKDYHGVAGLLPFALPAATPPPKSELLGRIFQQSRPGESDRPSIRLGGWVRGVLTPFISPTWQPAVSVVLLVLVAAVGGYAWFAHTEAVSERELRAKIETVLQEASARTAALQGQLTQQEQTLAALRREFTERLGTLSDAEDRLIQREAELDSLKSELAKHEQEAARLRKALAQRDDMLTLLRSAHVTVVSLSGLEHAKGAGAFLLYDRESQKAFLYAFNMPPLPPGKTYQLWAIVDKPISAGTFTPDSGQKGRIVVKNLPALSRITKFAVSLEPEGGRPQPTGQIYLAGQV